MKALPLIEYHPERSLGAIFRLKKPRTVTLLFGTGKMVLVGAKSERQASDSFFSRGFHYFPKYLKMCVPLSPILILDVEKPLAYTLIR